MKNPRPNPLVWSLIAALTPLIAVLLFSRAISPVQAANPVQAAKPVQPLNSGQPQPVLVELFTSEGCSSCPPADALLAQLDQQQFVSGAQAIVLSEHVSYWNGLGWHDPFSSEAFTNRQNTYAAQFGISGPYTPQAVVDGGWEVVGSSRSGLTRAVQSAANSPKTPLSLEGLHWEGDTLQAQVTAGRFPKSTLTVALADDSDQSNVLRGENEGRDLRHVAVVRTLVEVRRTAGPLNNFPIQVKLPNGVQPQPKMRLIVFLTDPHSGRVLGAAMQPVNR